MKKDTNLVSIQIRYSDGSYLDISQYELDRIKKLGEAMDWIQRAKNVYDNLKVLFEKSE